MDTSINERRRLSNAIMDMIISDYVEYKNLLTAAEVIAVLESIKHELETKYCSKDKTK